MKFSFIYLSYYVYLRSLRNPFKKLLSENIKLKFVSAGKKYHQSFKLTKKIKKNIKIVLCIMLNDQNTHITIMEKTG